VAAARSPQLKERLARDGVEAVGGTPAEFATRISREIVQWRELAKSAQISLQ
jgi:tripartite-type tricarboxylate transporter receptor subunit TctC